MKLLIASDIHGDIESAKILTEAFKNNKCDKILLLGDILYHGPRNDLPGRYAPKEVIAKLTVAKQTQDVHTPLISQLVVYKWLTECDIEGHINKIREIYKRKLNLLCDCIDSELSDFLTYHRPEGGLFVWAKLNDGIDMLDFVKKASAAGVSVVPGNAMMVDGDAPCSYIRMNFSTPSDEGIVKGVKILGEVARNL